MRRVFRLRARPRGLVEAVVAGRAQVAGVNQHARLDEDAIAVLQRADDRAGVAAREEMPLQRPQRAAQVAREKPLRRLEEISLGKIRRQLRDVLFLDHRAITDVGGELARLLRQQPRVGADLLEQHFHRALSKRRAALARFGEHHRRKRVPGSFAVAAAGEREVTVGLAPFRKTPPAIDRRGRDDNRHVVGADLRQQFLQRLDLPQRALGAASHAVRQEIDVLEPHDALAAEHRDGLHRVAEPIHRGLDLVDVSGEPAHDLAREIIGARLGRERLEELLAHPVDEKVIRTADEDEIFSDGGHRAEICPRNSGKRTKKVS